MPSIASAARPPRPAGRRCRGRGPPTPPSGRPDRDCAARAPALVGEVVDLVGDQQHGRARAAQDLRDLLVPRRQTGPRIDHEQHQVGLLHSLAGPEPPRRPASASRLRHPPRRCRPAGTLAAPFAHVSLRSRVTPGRLVHDRCRDGGQPVDQRRLAGVGEAAPPPRIPAIVRGSGGGVSVSSVLTGPLVARLDVLISSSAVSR